MLVGLSGYSKTEGEKGNLNMLGLQIIGIAIGISCGIVFGKIGGRYPRYSKKFFYCLFLCVITTLILNLVVLFTYIILFENQVKI